MGRPERSLEPDGTPGTDFAIALRALREAAGRPSYREMAAQALRSQTALSEAAGGSRLPTWDTAESYARACSATADQIEELRALWLLASPASSDPASSDPASSDPAGQPGVAPVGQSGTPVQPGPRIPWLIAAGVLVLAAVLAVSWILIRPGATPIKRQAAEVPLTIGPAADGADPRDANCALDPRVKTLGPTEVDYRGQPAGFAQLRYSPGCGVAWPRFEPFAKAGIPAGVTVHVDIVRPGDDNQREAFDAPYVGEAVFGNVLLSTKRCTYAAVWLGDGSSAMPEVHTVCFRGAIPMDLVSSPSETG